MPAPPTFVQSMRRRLGPGVFALMSTILIVHLVFLVLRSSPTVQYVYGSWLALSVPALADGKVWTLLTYGLLHDLHSITHVLFNALGLFFFGPQLEQRIGTRRFLTLVAAAIATGGLLQAGWHLASGDASTVVGLSAATMAMLAAFAWEHPYAKILLFFVLPIEARWIIPLTVGLDLLAFLSGSDVAFFAHLGGLVAAWFLLKVGASPRRAMAHARGWTAWLSRRRGGGGGLGGGTSSRPKVTPIGKRQAGGRTFEVIPGGRAGDPRDRSTWN